METREGAPDNGDAPETGGRRRARGAPATGVLPESAVSGTSRRAAAIVLAAGLSPALALLLPALAAPNAVLGDPERGVYPALHAASVLAQGRDLVLGFPGDLPEAALDPLLATVLRVAPAVTPAHVVEGAAFVGVLVGAWLHRRWAELLGYAREDWSSGAIVAVGVAGPSILHAWLGGAPAWGQSWALVAVPVATACGGSRTTAWTWAVGAGLLVGALAAPLVPAALVVAIATAVVATQGDVSADPAATRNVIMRDNAPTLAGLVVAGGVAVALGARPDLTHVGLADLLGGVSVTSGAPDPTRGYVGAVPLLAALAGLCAREGRALGAAALVCALAACVPGGLHLVPGASMLAGASALATLRARVLPENAGALAVLLAASLVADGARGVGLRGSVPTASLEVPEVVHRLAPGPVLDLPLAPGKLRERLYWQLVHERPLATDAAGLVAPEVLALATSLARADDRSPATTCPDPRVLGFRSLVVRREAEFHDLATLVACFGPPTASTDDLAVWDLTALPGPAK